MKSLFLICGLFLCSPMCGQSSHHGSLVTYIVSQRADYVAIGSESRTVTFSGKYVNDSACKIISLDSNTLFFETGSNIVIVSNGKSWKSLVTARNIYKATQQKDSVSLAKAWSEQAIAWFNHQPDTVKRPSVLSPEGNIVTGGFITFGATGKVSVNSMDVKYDFKTHNVYAESNTVGPGLVGVTGVQQGKELVSEFFKGSSQRALRAFGGTGVVRQVANNAYSDAELVRKAITFAEDNATGTDKDAMGGPLDIGIIFRNGMSWIDRKDICSKEDLLVTSVRH